MAATDRALVDGVPEMVEWVAHGLAMAEGISADRFSPDTHELRILARAEAMREPTNKMMFEGAYSCDCDCDGSAGFVPNHEIRRAWQAMIDAALGKQ